MSTFLLDDESYLNINNEESYSEFELSDEIIAYISDNSDLEVENYEYCLALSKLSMSVITKEQDNDALLFGKILIFFRPKNRFR